MPLGSLLSLQLLHMAIIRQSVLPPLPTQRSEIDIYQRLVIVIVVAPCLVGLDGLPDPIGRHRGFRRDSPFDLVEFVFELLLARPDLGSAWAAVGFEGEQFGMSLAG